VTAIGPLTGSPLLREQTFVVETEAFSGPLDLLLHLIRQDEIEIVEIPIARIADQFLAVMHDLGLNQAADYLEMAARLLRIKAQMLLPRPLDDDDWQDPRYELVRRLLEYQQIREVADWLGAHAAQRAEQFPRGFVPDPPAPEPAPLRLELWELLAAVDQLLTVIPDPVLHRVVARPLDVEGASERLEALLDEHDQLEWGDLFVGRRTIVDILSMLIAVLEFARLRRISISQRGNFAPLLVVRESADAPD
jgi:segregation and condensation protein A